MLKLSIESTFDEFAPIVSGEKIPAVVDRQRADYLFRSASVIAELKCIERDIDMPRYAEKLTVRMNNWQRAGLLRVYGTTTVDLQKLAKPCQDDWLELHEKPLQRLLEKANRQMRQTKEDFGSPNATGVLLLANEAQLSSSPINLATYLARISRKKKSDSEKLFSNIQYIVVFAVNLMVVSPEFPNGCFPWISFCREVEDETMGTFLAGLGTSWMKFCAAKRGDVNAEVVFPKTGLEGLEFAKPPA